MAGHSQFKNIMHRKGRQDAARSKLFSKLSKEITVAARMGDPNPDANPRLRLAIQNARAQSMPKENIQRAINKSQVGDCADYEEIFYEGYGPGGVAIVVEALTDNRNRTASNVRAAFSKQGGTLGETGSVLFMFRRIGRITYLPEIAASDKFFEVAIMAGADDVTSDEDGHVMTCEFLDVGTVSAVLEESFGAAEDVRVIWEPCLFTSVDYKKAPQLMALISVLEDDEDVRNVYANFEIDDELLSNLARKA
ncbi:MAG: YebC/PmpR family DNA-binding transcriptional regulator [Alphaproteobacteria bacterium]|nr:YebC/PmpR family DNA-binding transcriptional regulator [Alphaproteobacteria bacterium]